MTRKNYTDISKSEYTPNEANESVGKLYRCPNCHGRVSYQDGMYFCSYCVDFPEYSCMFEKHELLCNYKKQY